MTKVEEVVRAMEAEALRFNEEMRVPIGESRTFNTGAAHRMTMRLALAALKAMREPNEAMLSAAFHADIVDEPNNAYAYDEGVWEAMIDAAIAEAEA